MEEEESLEERIKTCKHFEDFFHRLFSQETILVKRKITFHSTCQKVVFQKYENTRVSYTSDPSTISHQVRMEYMIFENYSERSKESC